MGGCLDKGCACLDKEYDVCCSWCETQKARRKAEMEKNSKIFPILEGHELDIASKISPYLEAYDLLNFVLCRKDYRQREYLTYPLVLRSILMTGGAAKAEIPYILLGLRHLEYGKTDVPGPLGILRYACGKSNFRDTFQINEVYPCPGEISPEYNDQNAKAIEKAIEDNRQDSVEREAWRRENVDQVLQQLANLLGDHPCQELVLNDRAYKTYKTYSGSDPYVFHNSFVNSTIYYFLDLTNPSTITKKQLVDASCELMEHYGEFKRQDRILGHLRTIASKNGTTEFLGDLGRPRWKYPKKRYTFYREGADKILEEFLMKRGDKDNQPAVVAKEIHDALKESPIYQQFLKRYGHDKIPLKAPRFHQRVARKLHLLQRGRR